MKGIFLGVLLSALGTLMPIHRAHAQIAVLEIIKAGVKRVIKAVDLKIQRMQNETVWLQNAQKSLENALSQTKLEEISGWMERQRTLYKDYFDELNQVKTVITYYQRIRDVVNLEVRVVEEYRRAWELLRQDKHFSADELDFMGKVYDGILRVTSENVDKLLLVVSSFKTQMNDAERLELLNEAADEVEVNYQDLTAFNQENGLLSLSRAQDAAEAKGIRLMYGLQ